MSGAGDATIAEIDQALEAAVAEGLTVGCVGLVADRDGVIHASAHGRRSAGAADPMTLDTVFQLASMTKAIGTAAALRLVEQGRLSLDTPVEEVLPDFAALQIFEGFDGETPRFRPRRRPCTIRHLMTHTAGLAYDSWSHEQARLCRQLGVERRKAGRRGLMAFPFHREPGEKWEYSVATDWLGLAVEAAAGEPIEPFLSREIFELLGMTATDARFRTDMADRRAAVHAPRAEGGFDALDIDISAPDYVSMGGGLKGTGPDYLRFCRMILGGGALDGRRVLAPESVQAMSENAIGALRLTTLPTANAAVTAPLEIFPGVEKSFTLGFMRNETDMPGKRRAGSLCWAGIFNTHYWIDPSAGIAAVLMMQQSPFLSAEAVETYDAFERAVYAAL